MKGLVDEAELWIQKTSDTQERVSKVSIAELEASIATAVTKRIVLEIKSSLNMLLYIYLLLLLVTSVPSLAVTALKIIIIFM